MKTKNRECFYMNILSVTKSAFNIKLIIDKYTRDTLKLSYIRINQ